MKTNGANATLEQIKPFYDYIQFFVVRKLGFAIQLIKGLISDISETDEKQQKESISTDNVSIKNKIIDIMIQMP